MKKNLIPILTILISILVVTFWYFGYNYLIEEKEATKKEFINKMNRECSSDVQKVAKETKDQRKALNQNFYSPKLGTCVIFGVELLGSWEGNVTSAYYFLEELYTGRNIIKSENICNSIDECAFISYYDNLWKIEQDKLKSELEKGSDGNALTYFTARKDSIKTKILEEMKEYQ